MASKTTKRKPSAKAPKAKKATPRRKAAPPRTQALTARPGKVVRDDGPAFPIEIDPRRIEETLGKVREQLTRWTNKGRYTRVRLKFRGKPMLPDLPLAAFVAAEGLTFYWGGILRALLMNVAGKSVFDVELVNDSEQRLQRGKEALLQGELDRALECFREAAGMDEDSASAHLNLGIALKLKGERQQSRTALERARALDPEGAVGAEAERVLAGLTPEDVVALSPRPGG